MLNVNNMINDLDDKIHIVCLYGPVHAGARIYPVRNPKTGEFPSCIRKVNSYGDIIYQKNDDPGEYFVKETDSFVVKSGTDFDLSNDVEKKNWEAIKFSDLIFDSKGKFDEKGNVVVEPTDKIPASAIFTVERIADETKKRNDSKRLKNKALNFIYQDSDTGLALKAKVLGCFIKNSTREEIEEFVTNFAEKNPEKVIELYTGSDMKLHLIFLYAKEKNILINKGGIYVYGESNMIGRTEDDCVKFFKEPNNKVITDKIIKELSDVLKDVEDKKEAAQETTQESVEDKKGKK